MIHQNIIMNVWELQVLLVRTSLTNFASAQSIYKESYSCHYHRSNPGGLRGIVAAVVTIIIAAIIIFITY